MLEKDPGSPKLNHLQIIIIVETDMNMIMKGWTALDALLLKITMMDLLHLFCLNGGLLNNNAVACYDRMIPALSSLHLQNLGLPETAAKCSVQLNKKMKHYVRTNASKSSK
eukprot:4936012-Ditylum_brightwellii.AAC.1